MMSLNTFVKPIDSRTLIYSFEKPLNEARLCRHKCTPFIGSLKAITATNPKDRASV